MALGAKSPLQTWDSIDDLCKNKDTDGKVYKIPCTFKLFGVMDVKAESLEKAIEKARSTEPLPIDNSVLMSETFEIDATVLEYNREDCI